MIPPGISHLCPLCVTVGGKTYGGAREKRRLRRGGRRGRREIAKRPGRHLWGAARDFGKRKGLWFLAQREGGRGGKLSE